MKHVLLASALVAGACGDRVLEVPSSSTSTSGPSTSVFPAPHDQKVGTILTLAGNGTEQYSGDGGPATKAALSSPFAVAPGTDGELWIADTNNYVLRSVDSHGVIRTRVGSGLLGDSPRDQGEATCPASDARFNRISGLAFAGRTLYIAAAYDSDVKAVDLDAMTVRDVAGISKRTYYTGDEGAALSAALDLPTGIAIAPNGDVTVLDEINEVIRRVDSSGVIHHVAGVCAADDDGYGSGCAHTDVPTHADTVLHACPDITIKTSDTSTITVPSNKMTHCVEDATGNASSWACQWPCTPAESGDGGPATAMRMDGSASSLLATIERLAYDAAGNLFFTEIGSGRIRKIDTSGIVSTVAGANGELSGPTDVAIDTDGSIYIADTGNNCVRKVDPSGTISTVAGVCSPGYPCEQLDGDSCNVSVLGDGGPATSAQLNHPMGIALQGDELYIADTSNNRIRAVRLR